MTNNELTPAQRAGLEANRMPTGRFGEAVHSAPAASLETGAAEANATYVSTSPWEADDEEVWQAEVEQTLAAFGPYTAVEDGNYTHSLEVTDPAGKQWFIIRQDKAIDGIVADLEEGDTAANVPTWMLEQQTGVNERVFDELKAIEGEDPSSYIQSVIQATDSTRKIATTIASREYDAADWFRTKRGAFRKLDENGTIAYLRE